MLRQGKSRQPPGGLRRRELARRLAVGVLARRLAVGVLLAALSTPPGAAEVDLSPASWPAGELERYTELNQQSGRRREPVHAEEGMVAGTTGALAVRAGVEALIQGGSAVDAALTTALAEITLAAGSWVSFAGTMTLVAFDATSGKARFVNGGFTTLLEEDDPLSIPASGPSGRSVMVPGFMAGVAAAHDNWGVLPFAQLFEPAIYFAREGFPIDQDLAATIEFRRPVLARLPATREIFFKPDGDLYSRGDLFVQPRLAETLSRIAEDGIAHVYTGPWAESFVAAVRAEGGRLTMADLAAYRPIVKRARKARFRDYVAHVPNKPNAGGILVKSALKALKKSDLAAMGHYTESADSLFALMTATRDQYRLVPPLNHSDAVVAVDREGNVAALLHSINTLAWGETGLFVDGISIPDAAAHQQQRIATAGPGNRIWAGGDPLIVTRRRVPVLASSSIGNGLFEATLQSVINVLEYGMDPKQAIDTPIFRSPVRTADGIGATRVTSGDFPPELLDALRERGILLSVLPRSDFQGTGFWVGIGRRDADSPLVGAVPDVFNGLALGH